MGKFQKKIVLVFLLATLLLGAGWACYPTLLGLWADRLYAQANQAEDKEVPALIDQLAMLGTPALPRLAAALGSERKAVAHSARACFLKMIEKWEHPDTRPRAEVRLAVVSSIANQMKHYGPASRRHAVTLARRMLQISNDGLTQREANQFLLACESILDASRSAAAKEESVIASASEASQAEQVTSTESEDGVTPLELNETTTKPGTTTPLSERSLVELARLPGGDLPPALPELSSQRLAPEQGGGRSTTPLTRPPRALRSRPILAEEKRPSGDLSHDLAEEGSYANTSNSDLASDRNDRLHRLPKTPALRPVAPPEESITAGTSPRYGLGTSPEPGTDHVYSLIQQLRSTDPHQADQARRELSVGGFKTIHFALAERLTDPDPLVRKKLAQVLPRLNSVQTESWLKWLLKDDDANVRHEALMTLASSTNKTLLAEVAHIAQTDTNPKIRLEGQQIERRLAR